MSFISSLKSIFGFGPDPDFDTDPDTTDDPDLGSTETNTSVAAEDDTPDIEGLTTVPTLPEIDPAIKAKIFDGAVAVFNEALPDFLRRSVDPEAQSRRLAEAIDSGVRQYLDGIMLEAEQYAEAKLKGATETARRDAERLRTDLQLVEQQRTSLQQKQLSADRRSRALTDRVADLEAQVAALEAEREQFELENRSLVNKLKVADLRPSDGSSEELTTQYQTAVEQRDAAVKERDAAIEERDAAIEERDAALKERDKALQELADNKTQQEMSQAMYNDLQNTLAAERDAHSKVKAELTEAQTIVASVAELQAQMTQVEEVIRKRDERIERLKATNKKLREQLSATQESLDRARTVDNGLFSAPSDAAPSGDFAAIEDEFECPDWFVSEPAPGEVSPLLQPSAEFGYQEPPRKPRRPENDAQLSLF